MRIDRLDRSWIIESAAILFVAICGMAGGCVWFFEYLAKEPEKLANPYDGLRKRDWHENEMTNPNPLHEGEKR